MIPDALRPRGAAGRSCGESEAYRITCSRYLSEDIFLGHFIFEGPRWLIERPVSGQVETNGRKARFVEKERPPCLTPIVIVGRGEAMEHDHVAERSRSRHDRRRYPTA